VFERLTSASGDEKDERERSRAGRRPLFEGNWGLYFWMPIVDTKQKVENEKSI
jgi:hypothetical protein